MYTHSISCVMFIKQLVFNYLLCYVFIPSAIYSHLYMYRFLAKKVVGMLCPPCAADPPTVGSSPLGGEASRIGGWHCLTLNCILKHVFVCICICARIV